MMHDTLVNTMVLKHVELGVFKNVMVLPWVDYANVHDKEKVNLFEIKFKRH